MATSFNALVEAFNFNPITYIDRSWLPMEIASSDGQAIDIAALSLQSQIQLSEYILFRHGLIAYSDLFLAAPAKRLALLDQKLLLELSAVLGLAIYKESLRTAIDRETIANLKMNYSQQHLALVLKLASDVKPLLRTSPQMNFTGDNLRERLAFQGLTLLCNLVKPSWRAVHGRLRMKFPRSLVERVQPIEHLMDDYAIFQLIVKHLLPELGAEWVWLFS